MSLSTQPYKGTRDFYPEDKRVQKYMFNKWREVFESFGYEEYDAPVLEPTDLYLAKGNEEIVQEQTYTFKDRGDRSVTMRTEMTPTVSRMVAARRQELPFPLRWYSIPNLWRYERPQKGRLREFWQPNVDLFGIAGIEGEQEIIEVANAIMKAFGAAPSMYTIKLNNRELMDYITKEYLGLSTENAEALIRLIDRLNKLSKDEFNERMLAIVGNTEAGTETMRKLYEILNAKKMNDLPEVVLQQPCSLKLSALLELLSIRGITNAVYDPTLMRGFDYYTGIVFEVFDNDPDNNRAMFGGGRYDGLVAQFGVEAVPTVGFAFGDVTFQNFLVSHGLLPVIKSETDIYAIPVGDVLEQSLRVADELRASGVNVAVDMSGRKMDKQIKMALKKNIPYALFIGEQEIKDGTYKLKNLAEGNEETHSVPRIVTIVKDQRRI